jgi:hypothetical protein
MKSPENLRTIWFEGEMLPKWDCALSRRRGMSIDAKPGWPFDQPRNCTTITMRQVMEGIEPILLVSHDADDPGWQFIGNTDANVPDGRVVCLEEIVQLDPTVLEVADPGWQAVRDYLGGRWLRREHPPVADDE